MPYDDPDPGDPMVLNGVAFETTPEVALEAAYTYAEEFARLGHEKEAILLVFRSPGYNGPNSTLGVLGLEKITEIINECCAAFESCRASLRRS